MATNIVSLNILITCFLLLFCTFSTAFRIPLDPSDIHQSDDDSFLDEEDAIFLPSQNLPELDSHPSQETTHHHSTTKTTEEALEESKPLPLTVFRFGPIDSSRFPRRPLRLSSGRPVRHRCHHHTHDYYKPWNNHYLPRRDGDAVITKINELDKEFDMAARGGEAREVTDDWMRFEDNINEPITLSRKRSKAMEKSELLKRIYNRYNQRRQEEAEKKMKEKGSTFVKRIRKFLNGL